MTDQVTDIEAELIAARVEASDLAGENARLRALLAEVANLVRVYSVPNMDIVDRIDAVLARSAAAGEA